MSAAPAARLRWDAVFGWRMRRQLLDPVGTLPVPDVVRTLCGVQAQVSSSAELAIATRRAGGRSGEASTALAERRLIRTWAMRGTLHLLAPQDAGAYLALVGALRSWERAAWQRNFGVTAADIETLAEHVAEILDGRVLERDELIEEIAARTGSRELDEHLRSGWSAVLKPLAWMGLLCNGPSRGNRVTFTTPASWIEDWHGLPDPDSAAAIAIPAYLRAHGPATMSAFDAWLTRNSSRRADLRRWFDLLGDELVTVDVEGESCFALAADLDALTDAVPSDAVRLLAGFDQYILGPGTGDERLISSGRRALVSKAAGWISPVVVHRGRVAGTWELDGEVLSVSLFDEGDAIGRDALVAEATRIGSCLGRDLRLDLTT